MNEEVNQTAPEIASSANSVEDNCKEILGSDFSVFQKSNLVNAYTGHTKADEVREALESYAKVKDAALKDLDIEDLNSVMYLEEIREKKEIDTWKTKGINVNANEIPNVYDAMAINNKVTTSEYLKSIPVIIKEIATNN